MSEQKSGSQQGSSLPATPEYGGEAPTGPFVLALVSGVLIVLGALVPMVYMGSYGEMGDMMGGPPTGGLIDTDSPLFGILGVAFGGVVLFGALMLNSRPKQHATWGALILIFAALSPFGAMGGFGVGMVAGLIGGAWAIAWKPTRSQAFDFGRFCPNCGRGVSLDARFCSYCGNELPA